jgi:hypothetical protein
MESLIRTVPTDEQAAAFPVRNVPTRIPPVAMIPAVDPIYPPDELDGEVV